MSKLRSWLDWELEYVDSVPEAEEIASYPVAYVTDCSDWEEAETIRGNYERAMSKRSDYLCNDLADHLYYHAVMFQPNPTEGSTLVGTLANDIFIASHFAPATRRGGVELLKRAANANTPFVFAVPQNLAEQLVRLGFKDTQIDVPQWFNGEYISKRIVVNNSTTAEDLQTLAEKFQY